MANRCATNEQIIEIGGPEYGPPPLPGTVPPEVLDFFATLACSIVGDCFGDRKSEAHTFLTLHMLAVWIGDGNEAGPANARSIDKISESYAATGLATQGNAWLNLTKWGRLYQALDKFRVVIPFAVKTNPRIVGRGGCGC